MDQSKQEVGALPGPEASADAATLASGLALPRPRTVLEDTASELLKALQEYDSAFTDFDPNKKASRHRMRLAVIAGRAAIAKATGAPQ